MCSPTVHYKWIQVGFDIASVLVVLGAIALMAFILGVSAPTWLVGVAIIAGGVLGYFQGVQMEVVAGTGGLFARRSPVGILLWGAGIIVMQAAGIAWPPSKTMQNRRRRSRKPKARRSIRRRRRS